MKRYIYADNAATTKLDTEAFEAMLPWLTENYGNASQPYFFGKKAAHAIKEARQTIAECINADPDNIFFTSGGTESDNWAIKCFGASPTDAKIIVVSAIEHHAILHACKNQSNATVIYLPVDKDGIVKGEDLVMAYDHSNYPACSRASYLTSIMMANNEIGTIMPIKDLAAIAHENGSAFHTDAVQAVGHIPIDVKGLGVDMLSASAHKFNGPKGIGFFYDSGKHVYPHNDGGAQEFGMRAGTENVAGIVGMAVALKNNCANLESNMKYIMSLEDYFMDLMEHSGLDFIRNGGRNHIPGNINLSFRNADGEAILHRLDLKGICISTGSACDSVNTQISHVIRAVGIPQEYANGTIRISLGKYNTLDDCDSIVEALVKILSLSQK